MTRRKLRIALLGTGSSKHIQRLARNMARREHTVFVITADKYGPFPNDPGVQYLTFDSSVSGFQKIKQVRELLAQSNPDVLHSHFMSYGGFIGVTTGFHPHLASLWGCDILNVPRESLPKLVATKVALRASDWLLPVSRQLRDEALRLAHGHPNFDIVNWGIDTEHFSPNVDRLAFRKKAGVAEDEKLIFSPRILEWHYNQNVLLDALPLLKQVLPEQKIKLVILRFQAVAAYEAELKAQVARLGLENDVIWLDEVPYDELPVAYSAADVVVSIPRTDGTPMTVLEAMACGALMVASDLPSLRDWITPGKDGALAQTQDPQSVAQAVAQLLTVTDEARKKMSEHARQEIVDRVAMDKSLEHLEGIYLAAAQSSGFDFSRTLKNLAGLRS